MHDGISKTQESRRTMQEDWQFDASLGCIAKPSLKTQLDKKYCYKKHNSLNNYCVGSALVMYYLVYSFLSSMA